MINEIHDRIIKDCKKLRSIIFNSYFYSSKNESNYSKQWHVAIKYSVHQLALNRLFAVLHYFTTELFNLQASYPYTRIATVTSALYL